MLNVTAPLTRENEISVPYITVEDPNGNVSKVPIENDANLLIGSDENCRLRLRGEDIQPEQCMVFRVGDHVTLRDWYSEGMTLLNGQPFSGMQPIKCGDVVKIAQFKLAFVLSESSANATPLGQPYAQAAPVDNLSQKSMTNDLREEFGMVPNQNQQVDSYPQNIANTDVHQMERELSEARHEIEQLQAALERQLELEIETPDAEFGVQDESDEINRLKEQIDVLNAQLAERDADVYSSNVSSGSDEPVDLDSEETERLVGRLEELLGELEQADRRVESMEHLLRTSEEAMQAEREERNQLEDWVSKIESVMSQKENEFENERDKLESKVKNANDSVAQLQQQIKTMVQQMDRSGGNAGHENLLNQLREQNDRLRDDLTASKDELDVIRKKHDELQNILDNQELPPAVQAKMQAMEVELAQTRAEVARNKATQAERPQLEKVEPPKSMNDADLRFQAMRDHLRDLSKQEAEEKKEKQLGARIANLWRRLNKR